MSKNEYVSENDIDLSFLIYPFIVILLILACGWAYDYDNNSKKYIKEIGFLIGDYENCISENNVNSSSGGGASCKNYLAKAALYINFLNKPYFFPDKNKEPDSYAKAQETIKNAIFKFIKYKHYDIAFSALHSSKDHINPDEVLDAINEISKREHILNSKYVYESLIEYNAYNVNQYLSEIDNKKLPNLSVSCELKPNK